MRFRRYLRAVGPALLLAVGGAYALSSLDWCQWPAAEQVKVVSVGMAKAQLHAGAAKAELSPPYPIVVAGHGPPRPDATKAAHPLYARATVLEMGGVKVGIVSLDLLLVTERIQEQVAARVAPLQLNDVWIAATHTHASFGAFDRRLMSEIAGTGNYREAAELAVVSAATTALEEAAKSLKPVSVFASEEKRPEFLEARSEGPRPNGELLRLVFKEGDALVAQWIFFAAHPTNVSRNTTELDGDFPGYVSRALEEKQKAPALFLQRAVGNAGAGNAEGEGTARAESLASRILDALEKKPLTPVEVPLIGYARVSVIPPHPDASRLVPSLVSRAGANFLCGSAPKVAELSGLQLGPYRFLSVPGEPTQGVAETLEASSGGRVVALVNGYVGYIETKELAEQGSGESKRQYFDSALTEHLDAAADAVGKLFGK